MRKHVCSRSQTFKHVHKQFSFTFNFAQIELDKAGLPWTSITSIQCVHTKINF
jgi:hypothetical protein